MQLLGPGTYHPNHPRGVELHDPFRNSAAFSSKTTNHLIDFSTDNTLSPSEYFLKKGQDSCKIHDPAHQNNAFKSTSSRFNTLVSSNTESELKREITMDDFKDWNKTKRTIAPKDRVDTAVTCNAIGSKESRRDGADKIYDTEPSLQERIKRMSGMRMSHSSTCKDSMSTKRFPDTLVKSRYTRESKPMGPASYKIKRKGIVVKDQNKASSSFKSTTARFKTKREPLVNYAGWNYNHQSMRKAYWSSNEGGGGYFNTSHGLKRFT